MDLKMDHKRGYVAKSRIPHSRSLALEQRNKPTAGQVMVSLRGQELRRITQKDGQGFRQITKYIKLDGHCNEKIELLLRISNFSSVLTVRQTVIFRTAGFALKLTCAAT